MVIVAVFGTPYGAPLLAGFVVLQQTEARLIKGTKIVYVIFHYYAVGR